MINRDITYCTSETCKHLCERHVSKYDFDPKEEYWFCDFNAGKNGCDWRMSDGKNS